MNHSTHIRQLVLCSLFAAVGDTEPAATAKITVMETEDMLAMFKGKAE